MVNDDARDPAAAGAAPELPRTLGLRDIFLLTLVAIVNLSLLPPVAGMGGPALWLWGVAFLLFFVPEVVAVIALAKRFPGEGGIYTWADRQFGPAHGFVSGWLYWTCNLFYFPMQLVYLAGILAYAAQGTTTLVDERWFVVSVAVGWLALVTAINIVGLGVGKWLPNVGAVCTAATAALIIGAGVIASRSAAPSVPASPVPASWPDVVSGLSVMCFAFIGVELASTMGSEIRRPERDLPRATLAAGVVALGVYVAVTWALQQLLPRADIGAIQGILQGVDLGARRLRLEWFATPLATVMAVALAGGLAGWYAGAARIPFTAGFNGSLPRVLGRVHPRFGSPWVALLLQGALTLVFIAATMWGATVREAYQVLLKSAVITTLIPFCYMFLGAARLRDEPAWKRVACGVGLAVSGAGIVSAFVPGADVTNVTAYEIKLLAGSLLPLAAGLALYARERRLP